MFTFINKNKFSRSLTAGFFSFITIGFISFLTFETDYGFFILASFGATMVLLYGYPDSPFAKPKNIFFGHFLTSLIGILFVNYFQFSLLISLPIAVGFGVGLMILFDVTHPPAGGNPIIIIMGSFSFDYLLSPVILGSIIIICSGMVLNRININKGGKSK